MQAWTEQVVFQNIRNQQFFVITTAGTGTVTVEYLHEDGVFCPAGDGIIEAGNSATVPLGGRQTRVRITPSSGATYNVW